MRSLVLGLLVACGGGGHSQMIDAAPDTPDTPDAFDPCTGGQVFLSGEMLDWDSSNATFKGVFMAKISVDGTQVLSTPPNGRLDVCVPPADPLVLDVDAPTDYLDGTMIVEREAITSLHPISFRGITATRAGTFFTERGLTFDANKAQVLVFLAGDRSSITLDRAHDATQTASDDASPGDFVWAAGDSGRYVLFPNVDPAQATATVTDPSGAQVVPIAAGKLTLVAVSFVFI